MRATLKDLVEAVAVQPVLQVCNLIRGESMMFCEKFPKKSRKILIM